MLIVLTLVACEKKDSDVICRRYLLSHPHVYADGETRKSDVFACAQSNGAGCTLIEPVDGGAWETDCAGDPLLSR